jgi:hypothetical protein
MPFRVVRNELGNHTPKHVPGEKKYPLIMAHRKLSARFSI